MAWNYLKQKTAKTPDARRNDKPVKQEKFVKDTNPVTGTRAARPQKPVTWTQYVVWISKNCASGGR